MAKSRNLLTRREFARRMNFRLSLVQEFIDGGRVLTAETGLIPGRTPRIDIRLVDARYALTAEQIERQNNHRTRIALRK
jgi:hypothetical protein